MCLYPQGYSYIPDFIDAELEKHILEELTQHVWSILGSRSVQQYGYEYSYRDKTIHPTTPMPEKLRELLDPVYQKFGCEFDQVLVNHYHYGQGIAPHIDADVFGDRVVVLSLGSHCTLRLEKLFTGEKHLARIEPRALYVMEGEVRSIWKHSIFAVGKVAKKEPVQDLNSRTSITFRSLR